MLTGRRSSLFDQRVKRPKVTCLRYYPDRSTATWILARRKNHGTSIAGGVGGTSVMQNVPDQLWHGRGHEWLSPGRTHLIHDLISHPVTNERVGATTRDVRFKYFYPRANNKAVNVIDTDNRETKLRSGVPSYILRQRANTSKRKISNSPRGIEDRSFFLQYLSSWDWSFVN